MTKREANEQQVAHNSKPRVVEITAESNPDVWACLQPPEVRERQEDLLALYPDADGHVELLPEADDNGQPPEDCYATYRSRYLTEVRIRDAAHKAALLRNRLGLYRSYRLGPR